MGLPCWCCPSSSLSCGLAPRLPSCWSAQYQPSRVIIPATRISIKFGFLMARPTSRQLWTLWTCTKNVHDPAGWWAKNTMDLRILTKCCPTFVDTVKPYTTRISNVALWNQRLLLFVAESQISCIFAPCAQTAHWEEKGAGDIRSSEMTNAAVVCCHLSFYAIV